MRYEKNYETALVEIIDHLKGFHRIISSVMVDVAALRHSVLVSDKSRAVYAERVKAGMEIGKPLLESALRSYDQMVTRIQGVRASSVEDADLPDADAGPQILH